MALREILAHFGFEVDSKELDEVNEKVGGLIDRIKDLGTALVGGAIVGEIFEFGKNIAESGEEIEKASIKLGIGTDALQELGFAAQQSGSDVGSMTIALLTLQDKVGDALINPAGDGAKSLKKYGIAFKDATGAIKPADQILQDVADKIADTKDESKQVAIAMGLFGRQGRALLPMLKQGKDGIAGLRDEFEELGGGMKEDAIKASTQYIEALHRVGVVTTTLKGQIGVVLLPVLQWFAETAVRVGKGLADIISHSSILQTVLGVLGIVLAKIAISTAAAFAPLLLSIAGIAVLVIILEDIVALFRGGKSAIGDFIDALFGVGTAVKVVRTLKDAFDGVVQSVKDAIDTYRLYQKLIKGQGFDLNDIKTYNRIASNTGLAAPVDTSAFDGSKQATLNRQRLEAYKNGQTFAAPGESREQAQAATAQLVKTGTAMVQDNRSTIHIHDVGKKSKKELVEAIEEALDGHNRKAADALIKHAEPDK